MILLDLNIQHQADSCYNILHCFTRYDDPFVLASFDNSPTADSEIYSKLDKSVRDSHEAKVSLSL